jgi:mono/diheme cytochrome c family protein
MRFPTRAPRAAGILLLALGCAAAATADAPNPPDHPIVPGFERIYADPDAQADQAQAQGGELLLGELNCVSCHATDRPILKKQAPILDHVGDRARPDWIRSFLRDPQATKPGATMPNLLAAWPEPERDNAVEALVQFLASTGVVDEAIPSRKSIDAGKTAFHTVGCVACHAPMEPAPSEKPSPPPVLATSVPFGDLAAKYSLPSLEAFLVNPSNARPSGRMPSLNLKDAEAHDIASYLLRDLTRTLRPNLKYACYEGSWDQLPDFATLTPKERGETVGFDLSVLPRQNDAAITFEGLLQVDRDGDYRFFATSDDGSRVWIDDKLVVDNDGIHPPQTKDGNATLTKGLHRFKAALFNGGGGTELAVEIQGPRLSRRAVDSALYLDPDGPRREAEELGEKAFVAQPELVEKGRSLFASLGCASCHQLTEANQPIASTARAPSLADLSGQGGCLAEKPSKNAPFYHLNTTQRDDLLKSIHEVPAQPAAEESVASRLVAFNCIACHRRNEIGGIEEPRNAYFQTTQKEMGDEGRIPPPLSRVGAKLTRQWLDRIMNEGAKDRPYMLTHMPRFGHENVGVLAADFEKADPVKPVAEVDFDGLAAKKVKSTGRHLVGGEAFGCIKCHTFRGIESTGVQSIDLTITTERLRREWFADYLRSPQSIRPGTRMPDFWPEGQSTLPKVLGGGVARQIESIWDYLSDGPKAQIPYGLGRDPIPLVVDKEALVYRAFIEGAGTRGIGVGLPEKVNYAFDANDMRLALIWQGAFMDASRHWSGRGEGYQPPLGDNVVNLPAGATVALLDSPSSPWPKERARDRGDRFLGYRLGKERRPTFRYQAGPVHVEDSPDGLAHDTGPTLRRTLTLTSSAPSTAYIRAAVGDTIEPKDGGWYGIDKDLQIHIVSDSKPILRESDGKKELLIPVPLNGKPATVVEEYKW